LGGKSVVRRSGGIGLDKKGVKGAVESSKPVTWGRIERFKDGVAGLTWQGEGIIVTEIVL